MSCDLEETSESLRCWEKIPSYIRIRDVSYVLSCSLKNSLITLRVVMQEYEKTIADMIGNCAALP